MPVARAVNAALGKSIVHALQTALPNPVFTTCRHPEYSTIYSSDEAAFDSANIRTVGPADRRAVRTAYAVASNKANASTIWTSFHATDRSTKYISVHPAEFVAIGAAISWA